MQANAFKALLDKLEEGNDPRAIDNFAYSLNRFEALAASIISLPYSKNAGIGNWWTKAHSAYADNDNDNDNDNAGDSLPVRCQSARLTSLAQLKANLRQDLSIKEFSRLRRQFASEHHPDRVPTAERNSASRRLAIANDLIDLAIQNASRKIVPR